MSRKTKRLKCLADSIDHYFSLCETIMDIKKQLKEDELFELRHESFLENPKAHLKDLCYFLGVGAPDDYLNDCSGIVYESPHKSRHQVEWSLELIGVVEKRIDEFPFLSGYTYNN